MSSHNLSVIATDSLETAVRYMRTLMTSIPCFKVNVMTVKVNTSVIDSSLIASRIGLVPVKQSTVDKDSYGRIDIKNNRKGRMVSTDDIEGIEFAQAVDLFYLWPGEEFEADFELYLGTERIHSGYAVAAQVATREVDGQAELRYLNLGCYSDEEILDLIKSNLAQAMQLPTSSTFYQLVRSLDTEPDFRFEIEEFSDRT